MIQRPARELLVAVLDWLEAAVADRGAVSARDRARSRLTFTTHSDPSSRALASTSGGWACRMRSKLLGSSPSFQPRIGVQHLTNSRLSTLNGDLRMFFLTSPVIALMSVAAAPAAVQCCSGARISQILTRPVELRASAIHELLDSLSRAGGPLVEADLDNSDTATVTLLWQGERLFGH